MRGRAAMEGVFFLIGLPVLLIAVLVFISALTTKAPAENPAFSVLIGIGWAVVIPGVVLALVNAATGGLAEETRQVLLTTPLEGAEIVRQTVAGQRVQMAFFLMPIIILIGFEMLSETISVIKSADAGAMANRIWFFVGSAITTAVYMWMIIWISMALGLFLRQRLRALLAGIVGMVAWAIVPIIGWNFVMDLMKIDPNTLKDSAWALPRQLSPAMMIYQLEFPETVKKTMSVAPWMLLALNTLWYGLLAWVLRSVCLRRADKLLGRE